MKLSALSLALAALAASACAPVSPADEPAIRDDPPAGVCPAPKYQSYVGRNRSTLPARPEGETWRVVCSTCAMTMDYSPSRLNIVYDEATGVIQQVKCG